MRRTVIALAASAAALAAAVPAAAAVPGDGDTAPQPALTQTVPAQAPRLDYAQVTPAHSAPAKHDRLRFTVKGSGNRAMNGTFTLSCHPAGGNHPQAKAACDAIDSAAADRAAEGADLFAPVPKNASCAMIHGGPATARVTGIWHGQRVDAKYSRINGCEIHRWDQLVPALPDAAKMAGEAK
ncbi:subtilase-type protease inhibitor [Streptomyces sp. N2-109]|uniref:Subtilase-type protease inhibitor n=1 Tax=Streptomyces gossypii TaxID=2883101 RepID=A0ABT2JND4_9ACTN|nr:subtilase-type protease inhibitor [Streptomyces gossypii]MCT2589386.1 subtilase-type protease inhibitor [Streptomyces gossypii]